MDELSEHLDALARDDCYRVDAVMKRGAFETTERVFFMGANGSEQGPYVRKYLDGEAGLGAAYERIWKAQRAGRRFLHLPLVIDCYSAGFRRAVVMEYVRGETLADVVYRCDPSVALARDVFPRLCDAVGELHESFDPPLIHRDLKPSNVMLTRDDLTIIDFGIARTFDEAADEDTRRFGTRAYAPPEQFGYGQTDVRTDVYALGMLLYFCLTERTPDAAARRVGYRAAGVPEPLRRVIERATAFDPAGRYPDAAALKEAFSGAVRFQGAGEARASSFRTADDGPSPTGAMSPPAAPSALSAGKAPDETATPSPSAPSAAGGSAPLPRGRMRRATQMLRRVLARVPYKAGVAWDVLLAAFFALSALAAVGTTFWPLPGSEIAGHSLAYRIVGYLAIVLLMEGPALVLVSDKRPLRRIFRLEGRSPRRRLPLIVLAMEIAGFAVFVILVQSGL